MDHAWRRHAKLVGQLFHCGHGRFHDEPRHGWRGWLIALGILCVSGTPAAGGRTSLNCPDSQASVTASFNFDAFTQGKPFELNTCMTTSYGPAWADVLVAPGELPALQGRAHRPVLLTRVADLSSVTPCEFSPDQTTANCTCYEIPGGTPYFVDINAILNLDVYRRTFEKCGSDGSNCLPTGRQLCPGVRRHQPEDVDSRRRPDLDLQYLPGRHPDGPDAVRHARSLCGVHDGAVHEDGGEVDPATKLPLVQCFLCPTFERARISWGQTLPPEQCVLPGNAVWSAAYSPGGTVSPRLSPAAFPMSRGGRGVRCCHQSRPTSPRHRRM